MFRRCCLWAVLISVPPSLADACVTRLRVDRREVILNGQPFGAAGPYEKLVGKLDFALDPALPQNRGIVDLTLAPMNCPRTIGRLPDACLGAPLLA